MKNVLQALEAACKNKDLAAIQRLNLLQTRTDIRASCTPDQLLVHAVHMSRDVEKMMSMLAKRMRDWYSFSLPEYVHTVADTPSFIAGTQRSRVDALRSMHLKEEEVMGVQFEKADAAMIARAAKAWEHLHDFQNMLLAYLDGLCAEHCPSLHALTGAPLTATFIAEAGSLKRLALLAPSTIQLLGAEKALFRHLRTGSRPPKYGVLFAHPLVQHASSTQKGKAARLLAEQIALAARADFFHHSLSGEKLLHDVEQKLSKTKTFKNTTKGV